jgi:hypothetical protein
MQSLISRFLAWLALKAVTLVVIGALGVAGTALWIFVRDGQLRERDRLVRRAELVAELGRQPELRAGAEARLQRWMVEIEVERQRVDRAARVLQTLTELDTWWERWFGDAEQARRNRDRAESVKRVREEAQQQIATLDRAREQAAREVTRIAEREVELRAELRALEAAQPEWVRYLVRGWEQARTGLAVAIAVYLFGPTLWKLFAYFALAPLIGHVRALRRPEGETDGVRLEARGVSVDVSLWPGDGLHVRQRFLHASDDGLDRRTTLLLDWAHPATSLASGLVELTSLRQTRAGTVGKVTLSDSRLTQQELCVVELAAGSSLVLRPRSLVATVVRGAEPVRLRARWLFRHRHAWAALQFRVFEVAGPCRLVIAGTRGVRVESLNGGDGTPVRRRVNRGSTLGFSSSLAHGVVRAETFWAYYRGHHSLFDDVYSGTGTLLYEQAGRTGEESSERRWGVLWSGVLRALGL